MEFSKLEDQKTYEYVFDYFYNMILSGELKLNDKISTERDIAEKLGVSRNSVREVMHMLEINGLLECVQGSGNYVRCNTHKYMLKCIDMIMALLNIHYTEIFYLRTGYELTALKLAIDEVEPEELENMNNILLSMDKAVTPKEGAVLDVHFHDAFVAASHNRLLIFYYSMMSQLMDKFIEDFRTRILMNKIRAEQLRRSHWNLYNALVKKDYAAGREALEKHFEVVEEQLKKYK